MQAEEAFEKPFDRAQTLRLLAFLGPYRRLLRRAVLLMITGSALNLAGPYVMMLILDDAIATADHRKLAWLSVLFLAIHLSSFVTERSRIRATSRLGQSVLYDMRQTVYNHIQGLSLRFYDSRPAGKIMVRVTNDIDSLNDLLSNGVVNLLTDVFTLGGIIGIMLTMHTRLALLSFCTVPVLVLLSTKLRRKIHSAWREVRRRIANINANLQETISGVRVVQAFTREDINLAQFAAINADNRDTWMKAVVVNGSFGPLVEVTGALGTAALYWFGARMLIGGEITLGTLVAFTSYMGRFWGPISSLSNFYNSLLAAMASAERVFEFLDTQPEVKDLVGAVDAGTFQGQVEFKNLTFGYYPERPVLHHLTFEARPGETVALVGPTGAGKSSIASLISRFYDPQLGCVTVDGRDLREFTVSSVRKQIGVVLQESFLFSGTIAENIKYGRMDATDAEMVAAAKAVHVDEFVRTFPDGYHTQVKERGGGVSVGQRQLIAFARALLADPRILILDEATASIDTRTEVLVQEALKSLLKGRTSFVIAHRLSTIREADRILVIDRGRIVEEGTHQDLLARRGTYYDLIRAQFGLDMAETMDPS
ncbi:MAG TPA: multidrug ABC transporter ATP-binding protein [Clostridiales bacterium UBA8153]|nr:multidrug ABC transporter ATP-binding protein [Clostridiales bacterium UBA8153]